MALAAKKKRSLPPMLTQYLEYKEQYPDCFLFFQVGDFYEVFFEDASIVASELNVTLTSRDKNSDDPIPMCGVPVAVIDTYLNRLVDRGHSVAIVSQTSAPQAGKKMVDRELERIVTPSVRLLGDAESSTSSALMAIYPLREDEVAIAFSFVQSGVVLVRESVPLDELRNEIARVSPGEVVLPAEVEGRAITRKLGWVRDIERRFGRISLKFRSAAFITDGESSGRRFSELEGYAGLGAAGRRSIRLLLSFLDETTVGSCLDVRRIVADTDEGRVVIDATTRRNLELTETMRGGTVEGSLYHHIDCTSTPGGARLLKSWVLGPLKCRKAISARLDAVDQVLSSPGLGQQLSRIFRGMTDLERVAARLDLKMVTARELVALRDSLKLIPAVRECFLSGSEQRTTPVADRIEELVASLDLPAGLLGLLERSLTDSPPTSMVEGGYIRDGYSDQLDHYRDVRKNGKQWINELEAREREESGISSLKIRFNNVLGYFFEVTRANLDKVPEKFVRRQTMTNAARFITDELKEQEEQILNARDNQIQLERELFQQLLGELEGYAPALRDVSQALSELDVYIGFSRLAERENYCRPEVVDSDVLEICDGKHPILASMLLGEFVPNSILLGDNGKRCVVLTGPNMGGKSTYLRQTALIVLLAQIGSYVPASSARVGVVDRIFARLGANDDLAEGESTFMVEMREAAHILGAATDRSLVLIDEIGRGTATADGLAIARAVLEWIVEKVFTRRS